MNFDKIGLCTIILLFVVTLSATCKEPAKMDPGSPFYKIPEITQGELRAKKFYTEGFVVKIYTCPPCPANADCKPCMRANIVISVNPILLPNYNLTGSELILFTQNPKQFKLGRKYKFLIKMNDTRSTSEPLNDLELVGHELLK